MERADLTGFSALLGESLTSRVDMLERLLRGSHYPSLGTYKEKLLTDTIRGFLPNSVDVGTGFVLFPHADDSPPAGVELYDPLNQSAFTVSKQCDILVYDSTRFPPVFKDGDFVVIRPEAVRAVIEVKGSLSVGEARSTLRSFHDFGTKWRQTQLFYKEHHQATSPKPSLFLFAWRVKRDRQGRPATSPKSLRNAIAQFYAANITKEEVGAYPFLQRMFVHNECDITAVAKVEDLGDRIATSFGWSAEDGRFLRIGADGKAFRDKDRTIAALLASLHVQVAERGSFNRFFSYTEEVRRHRDLPYQHSGFSCLWEDLETEVAKRMNSSTI